MRIKIISLLLLVVQNCYAQEELDFGIYFGNDFKFDSVTLSINGILVVEKIQLRNRMYDPKNLMIEQNKRNLLVMPYYGPFDTLKKVLVKNSTLLLDITLNNIRRHFSFDLNKGRYLYANYKYFRVGWSYFKMLQINQERTAPLIL